MKQKDEFTIGGVTVKSALPFETNYREKSPVVGEIVQGNAYVKDGSLCIFHHNHFYQPSPYYLYDDLYSVPFNKTLFGTVDAQGELQPLCGNLICDRVPETYVLPVPIEHQKTHIDRAVVIRPGLAPYKSGQMIFHRPHAGYDIVYNWNGIVKRVTKVHEEMVVGVWKV
jgi:hypothetical protein